MFKIPITKPYFDETDEAAVVGVLRSGWVVQGPKVQEFERLFADYVSVKHAVATTSCTTALHLGLLALGVNPGDEVIMPAFTFIATANAVEYCGAKPVFCDVNLRTFNIDVNKVEALITSKTKAIIPVSLFGLSADLPAVSAIAKRHGLKVLEDAACAVGSKIEGRHAGSWANAGTFSFHPRKAITTGEGGMLTTNDDVIANKARKLRDHAASKDDLERHVNIGGGLLPDFDDLGYNYRMTDIQGAIGVAQMSKLDGILTGRRRAASTYSEKLKDIPWLIAPSVPNGYEHAYQSYVCLLKDADYELPSTNNRIDNLNLERNSLMQKLASDGVSVRQGTHAIHTLGYYSNRYRLKPQDYPNTFLADRLSITLPLYWDMTQSEVSLVCDKLVSLYNN